MCPDGLITPQRDIWANGIPLADADYSFASEELRVEYDEYYNPPPKLSGKDRTSAPDEIMSGSAGDPVIAIAKNVQRVIEILAIPSEIRLEMQNRLLQSLGAGKFVAYGYTIPRNPADSRVKIPRDLFEPKFVNWENSNIRGAGLEFASVLVFESGLAREMDAELTKKAPAKEARSKRGPSSSQQAIEKAVRTLMDEGQLPNSKLQKENIPLVQIRVQELFTGEFPHNRGLSAESIRKVLANLVPRLKN